ncbi:quinolinate synthase NadA [Desulfovibrio mangrovi]|uniref:quinolinate synthase NadA n=1 Tax=Desulfovibrio mangrovi TaxID=2976983 RepID=UPI00224742FE|nr:quinolinate synthase NadA [Desulfovibrio mangrovi]UZP68419.1 quinolinate synthase NadA [Desulfovibrio mangrovi]
MTTHSEIISRIRSEMGDSLVIMGHHYQNDSVIRHVDLKGDSLELARKVESVQAEHIVFCGVYFMGESAALLAREGQKVYLPEPDANCVMSQMAPAARVDKVLNRLAESGRTIVPLTYVNSSVGVKAVCGKHGGSVCTSANAETMMRWAMDRGDAILFIPDKNLARNTANRLGIPEADWHMLNITKEGNAVDTTAAESARLLLWPGLCAIHARFNLRQIQTARETHAGIRVVVHPECSPEVVAAADAAGSTSFIINYVKQAEEGAAIAIGTEINLVERLAKEYAGRKTIVPLLESSCSHMASVTEDKLSITLQEVQNGTADPVRIPIGFTDHARVALERMLKACA